MNPFSALKNLRADYRAYVESFQRFRSDRIRQFVREGMDDGDLLWREPLIEISRRFRVGIPLEQLVTEKKLHPVWLRVFRTDPKKPDSPPIKPHFHQTEAFRIAVSENQNFVVATGTGSGKSFAFGLLTFIPSTMSDEGAKDSLANTARLICVGYEAVAVVLMIEAWMRLAPPGGKLDLDTPPSEALDRQEVVLLIGETFGVHTQKFLPIIRTDARGFFGFGEYDGPQGDSFQGRFAQLMPAGAAPADQQALARQLLDAVGLTQAVLRGTPFNN